MASATTGVTLGVAHELELEEQHATLEPVCLPEVAVGTNGGGHFAEVVIEIPPGDIAWHCGPACGVVVVHGDLNLTD